MELNCSASERVQYSDLHVVLFCIGIPDVVPSLECFKLVGTEDALNSGSTTFDKGRDLSLRN
jgi:hypothetical protein